MNRVYELKYNINPILESILSLNYKVAGPGLVTCQTKQDTHVLVLSPENPQANNLYSLCISTLNGVLLLENLYYFMVNNQKYYLIIERSFSSAATLLGSYGCCLNISKEFHALFDDIETVEMDLFKSLPTPLNIRFLYTYLCITSNTFKFSNEDYKEAFLSIKNLNGSRSSDVNTILDSSIPNQDKLIALYNLSK